MKIDMREASKKLVEKQPYKIIMDDHDLSVPATEYTTFLDVLTFSVHKPGKNFDNIPYSKWSGRYGIGVEEKTVDLINKDGDIVLHIPSSKYFKMQEPDEFQKEKEAFRFECDSNEIIIALKLTTYPIRGGKHSYILLLKEPLFVYEMQSRRDSVVFSEKKRQQHEAMGKIEMLWGANSEKEVENV